jgi:YggT family protein
MGQTVLVRAIRWVVEILTWIVIIDAVLTFVPSVDRRSPIVKLIRGITEPIYRPIRKVIPPFRMGDVGLDLSPIIVIVGLWLVGSLLIKLLTAS